MRFAEPEFLWALLVTLPLLAAFFFWSWRVKQKLIVRFVQSRLLPSLTVGVSPARQKFRLCLLAAAVAGILLALAGPQWGFTWEEASQSGLDIIVAVDTSRSMLATDATPTRIEKAKLAVYDLLSQAKEDRMGLVAFAGEAFLQCPLTLDDDAFRQNVAALDVGIIPQGGTALSQAIRTALDSFEKGNDNHKVIVLFTDGEDHDVDTDTMAAAKAASDAGIKIFTIGVGTASGELLQVRDEQGNMVFVKDDDGNVVKSHLNEALLEQIATVTGGFYLPLRGATPMETLYARGLAPLPKSSATSKLTRVYQERFHWFLGFAALCLISEMLVPEAARNRRAEKPATPLSPGLGKAAVMLCLLLLPLAVHASSGGAFDKYQSGDYQGAFQEYDRLAGIKTNDYRLKYDAGTAAYRAKKLEDAEKQLGAVLNSPDIAKDLATEEHTYFNLGNTLFQEGEPAQDPKTKQDRWEKSIADYSHALELSTNDAEARNNLAYVKQKLEELKQQQQQQKQNQDQKNQDKDQKQQQQKQQNQPDKKQPQNSPQQSSQNQNQQNQSGQSDQQNQSQQAQGQPNKPDQQKDQAQQQAEQNKEQQNNPGEAKPAGEDQRAQNPGEEQQTTAAVAGQMTKQEAQDMLDAAKEDEKALIFAPENPPNRTASTKLKDW